MGYEMQGIGIALDAESLAKDLVRLMREESDDNEVLIRFGLLPAKWMEAVKKEVEAVVRQRYSLLAGKDEYTVLINPGNPDAARVVTFKVSQVVSEALHEVALALYGSVDMVV